MEQRGGRLRGRDGPSQGSWSTTGAAMVRPLVLETQVDAHVVNFMCSRVHDLFGLHCGRLDRYLCREA